LTFDFQPRLEGRLLDMRPVEAGDFGALYALGCDPEVWALPYLFYAIERADFTAG
jgi:hypothetical protein